MHNARMRRFFSLLSLPIMIPYIVGFQLDEIETEFLHANARTPLGQFCSADVGLSAGAQRSMSTVRDSILRQSARGRTTTAFFPR